MRRLLAIPLFALVCSTAIHAQSVAGFGAITGIVLDQYGDGIPDTTITLTNPVIGIKRTMTTSDNGVFDAPALVPYSSYRMKVVRKGYQDWELKDFTVAVGETLNFNIRLFANKAATAEEALGALAAVQDTRTGVSTLITAQQIYDLPVNDRLIDKLVPLAPAAAESRDGTMAFRGETFTTAFLWDGVDINNMYFLNRPDPVPYVAMEAVSQAQVIAAAATAEFGNAAGGSINAVSRPATDSLHFALYDYFTKNSWSKPDPFGNGFAPTGQQHHAGAEIGLPALSDRLFVFGNAELVDGTSQSLNRIVNPLLTDSTGTSVTTTCTATTAQCAAATSFIKAQMNVKVPTSLHTENGFGRVDLRPTDGNAVTLSGGLLHKHSPNGLNNATVSTNGGLLGSNGTYTDTTRYARFGWTHVQSGTSINDARGYWFEDSINASTEPNLLPSTGQVAIYIAGTPLGGNPQLPSDLKEQRYGGADTFTITLGSHTLKIGAEMFRNTDQMNQLHSRYGAYYYPSFSAFALDYSGNVKQVKNYTTFAQTQGPATTDISTMGTQAFAQDTWKPLPGLLLNVGVRWERAKMPRPLAPNSGQYLTSSIPTPNVNFAPRIGISYLVNKRTVVRLGGGAYYQPFPGVLLRDLVLGSGLYQTNYIISPNIAGAPAFPKVLTNTTTVSTSLINEFYANGKFRNPYTEQITGAVEHRLTRLVSLVASYVDSRGLKQWSGSDQNLIAAKTTGETYTILDANNNQTGIYSTLLRSEIYGKSFLVNNESASNYRGATAQVRTAPIFGLTVQASYTWAHANDNLSGPPALSIIPSNSLVGDYRGDWGASKTDQRNRAVLNWTWAPTFTQDKDVLSRFLLNGWRISGIATAASSLYETAVVDVIGQQFSAVTMAYTSSLNGTGGWARVPFYPVNSLPIGSTTNVDLRITRMLPFTERWKGVLMFEVFNAANHQNNTGVNTIAYTATSGVLKPVANVGTPNAAYGYTFGSNMRRAEVAFRLEF